MHVRFSVAPPPLPSQARATYHRYMHPKEAFISHGILNPEIARMKDAASLSRRGAHGAKPGSSGGGVGGQRLGSASSSHSGSANGASGSITAIGGADDPASLSGDGARGGLTFVYPYGATMTVQSPAHPVLSSGPISYPLNRPVAGVWERPTDVLPGGKGGGDGAGGRRGSGSSGRGLMGARAPRPEDHESGFLVGLNGEYVSKIQNAFGYTRTHQTRRFLVFIREGGFGDVVMTDRIGLVRARGISVPLKGTPTGGNVQPCSCTSCCIRALRVDESETHSHAVSVVSLLRQRPKVQPFPHDLTKKVRHAKKKPPKS